MEDGTPGAVLQAFIRDSHSQSEMVQFHNNFALSKDIALQTAKCSPKAWKKFAQHIVNFRMGKTWNKIAISTMVDQDETDMVTLPHAFAGHL